jgi:branched-chain amino acid transport system ATP-binding protein
VSLLAVESLDVFYGNVQAVRDVSFVVGAGDILTLVGANGAGKTTILKTVAGLLSPARGRILFDGRDLAGRPAHTRAPEGIVLVPEARQLWPGMTVLENLEVGAWARAARREARRTLDEVLSMFPVLRERHAQKAGTLSGGEQQMCAIGRGLMGRPRLLLLDEPALGLSPRLVHEVFASLGAIRRAGVTILLVEQNVTHALRLADHAAVLETGRVTLSGTAKDLARDPRVQEEFLGVSAV